MPVTSDTRNMLTSTGSTFHNSGFRGIDPLRAFVQTAPNLPAVHATTGKMQDNRDFAQNFQPSMQMFSNPRDESAWQGRVHDPFGFETQTQSRGQGSRYQPNTDYSNLHSNWARIETRVAQNAGNQLAGTRSLPEPRTGLGYNSFSDSNQIQSRSGGAAGADEIAKVAQQTGQAGVNIYTAIRNNNAEKQFQLNSQNSGIHSDLHANMIRSAENSRNQVSNAAGNLGAIFGPIGAIAGTAIGNALTSRVNPNSDQFKTAYSNNGKVNPQDSGIAASNNTAGASGESQQQV